MPISQALGMDVIGQRLHVRELVVGLDDAVRIAARLPGVVNVDIQDSRARPGPPR